MIDPNDVLNRKYNTMSQAATPPSVPGSGFKVGIDAYNASVMPGSAAGPAAGTMQTAPTTAPAPTFNTTNYNVPGGGMQVTRPTSNALGMIQTMVLQGWKPTDAIAAVGGAAASDLDNTKTGLLPGESAANVGKTGAETGLINKTTARYDDVINSEVALRRAQGYNQYGAGAQNFSAANSLNQQWAGRNERGDPVNMYSPPGFGLPDYNKRYLRPLGGGGGL